MNERAQSLALAILQFAFALLLWALFHTAAQCHSEGGTTVRGLFWLECIR
jgi:hypothetical protein